MDEFEDRKFTQYLIPANVTTRFEFFPGFGWSEFKVVSIFCVIGVLLFVFLGIPKKTVSEINPIMINTQSAEVITKRVPYVPILVRFLAIVIPGMTSFFAVKRDPFTGLSLLTLLKNRKEFNKKQKLYLDVYGSGSEVRKNA